MIILFKDLRKYADIKTGVFMQVLLTIFLVILSTVLIFAENGFTASNVINQAPANQSTNTSNINTRQERADAVAKHLSGIVGIDIKVIIISDKRPQSYVYPGGIVVLTKGIMDIAKTNDELAFIIGHEIAHTINSKNEETIFQIIGTYNLPEGTNREIEADIVGMLIAEKAGFNPFASVKVLARMVKKDSFHSFSERLEAISRFISNKWDPYYWME